MKAPVRTLTSVAWVVVVLVTTFACGSDPTQARQREGGDQPTTARSLAAVVEDHLSDRLGKATSAGPELDGPRAVGGVGAELRYRAEKESSSPAVSVSVGTRASAEEFTCERLKVSNFNGCVATGGGVLFWEKETPEEDPGVVYVALRKGDATVLIFQSGPAITGDPRDLDLRISVDDMFAIAKDARVNVTTSATAIRAGEQLRSWTDQH